jgi:hypothetical protein
MVHNKSNLAPHGKSQSFDFTNGFTWQGECDVTVEELMGKKKRKPPAESSSSQSDGQFAKARRLIETELAAGPVLVVDMEQMAEDAGISFKTFKRAKDALGVTSFRRDGKWYWTLPIEVDYEVCPQGGQNEQGGQSVALVPLSQL